MVSFTKVQSCSFLFLAMMLPVVMLVNVNDFYSYSSGDNVAPTMLKFSAFQPITNLKYFPTSIFNGVEISFSGSISLHNTQFNQRVEINPLLLYGTTDFTGQVFFSITNNSVLLNKAKQEIAQSDISECTFIPSLLILGTWIDVSRNNVPGNTLQVAIVTDGLNATFLIILFADVNYISNSGVEVFIRFSDFTTTTSHDISLPYSNNVTSAPDRMLHSSKPGTYIIKLSQNTNEETCDNKCPKKGTEECKKILAKVVCLKLKQDNVTPIPHVCTSLLTDDN